MRSYHVSGNSVTPTQESDEAIRNDPRGLLHIWDEPKQHARYCLGCDPSVGITGWRRDLATDGDHKTDNGAIEIFQIDAIKVQIVGDDGKPEIDPHTKVPRFYYRDLQVAEFFAPVDAVEIARICNVLGRIFAGDADDQCLLVHEAYPGPGVLTTQELLRLGYANLWYWETIADSVAEQTTSVGWHSNINTQKILWYRSRRHLLEKRAEIQSRWLGAEYTGAVIDIEKMRARAAYGMHDDLLQAADMAIWAGHAWTYNMERTWEPVTEAAIYDPQLSAPTLGEYRSYKDAWADAIDNWD